MTGGPTPGVSPTGIRHVLFDADGVIQCIPGGWYTAINHGVIIGPRVPVR